MEKVAVIGLGYVGLPLAVRAKEKGYAVIGVDLDQSKLKSINSGVSPVVDGFVEDYFLTNPIDATDDFTQIADADIILICVPTPVDDNFVPNLGPVKGACEAVAKHVKKGSLVVLESTVNPGVSEEIVKPIFEEAGFTVGTDIYIAHCPERINPGDPKWNVTNIPRVVGAFSADGLAKAVTFYEKIVDGEIRPMKSIREAEAVKIVENSFRDINIAFVNELAQSFDRLGIDIKDVIDGASTKPFAFMPHYPACGIGGHCIPVDPYYLIEHAHKKVGFNHVFMRRARAINNYMPLYTVEKLQDALNDIKMPMNGTTVAVLGLAYKANVDDVRESPSFKIIKHLEKQHANVITFDPFVMEKSSEKTLEDTLAKADAIIVATNHDVFVNMDVKLLKSNNIRVVIDGKNCLDKDEIEKLKIPYYGIGR
jgi:UDP-N-acetyl-D-glucosamine dehydrogenase